MLVFILQQMTAIHNVEVGKNLVSVFCSYQIVNLMNMKSTLISLVMISRVLNMSPRSERVGPLGSAPIFNFG